MWEWWLDKEWMELYLTSDGLRSRRKFKRWEGTLVNYHNDKRKPTIKTNVITSNGPWDPSLGTRKSCIKIVDEVMKLSYFLNR